MKNSYVARSFTLIELMIVIAIMGTLSALIFGNFTTSLKKGRDAKRKEDLKHIQLAAEAYFEDVKNYPTSLVPGSQLCHPDGCDIKIYMQKIPLDINAGNSYVYESDGNTYFLYSCIENSQDRGEKVNTSGYEGTNCGLCGTCKFAVTNSTQFALSQNMPPAPTNPPTQQPTTTPVPQQPTATPIPQAQNTTAYRDEDNDGYTVGTAQQVALQNGSLPSGWKSNPSAQIDCDDKSANAYPGSPIWSVNPRSDGSWDFDCDGTVTIDPWFTCNTTLPADACYTSMPSGTAGWVGNTIPTTCGMTGQAWRHCFTSASSASCTEGVSYACNPCSPGVGYWVRSDNWFRQCK